MVCVCIYIYISSEQRQQRENRDIINAIIIYIAFAQRQQRGNREIIKSGVSFRPRILSHFSDQILTRPERYTLSLRAPGGCKFSGAAPRAEIVSTEQVK